jgi:hypothetical protein
VVGIGFVLCFLMVRRRKQAFAIMRLLGETSLQITGKALLEQGNMYEKISGHLTAYFFSSYDAY